MKSFIYITLALAIVVLLWRNAGKLSKVIDSITGLFGESFEAVTEVGDFK